MRYILGIIILTSILTSTKVEAQYDDYMNELNCLALNIYFESRGESSLGQKAVAWVTLNRTNSPEYPDDICDVVYDRGQFSWTRDKRSDDPKDDNAWARALYIAYVILKTHKVSNDPTDGAVMFHTSNSKPSWRKSYVVTTKIDGHIFYKKELSNG